MERTNPYLPLLGRVLIGVPFILSGLGKLAAHDFTSSLPLQQSMGTNSLDTAQAQ
jgi:uncharacterized membrane protein YphA (DoxX/SURF4 family)